MARFSVHLNIFQNTHIKYCNFRHNLIILHIETLIKLQYQSTVEFHCWYLEMFLTNTITTTRKWRKNTWRFMPLPDVLPIPLLNKTDNDIKDADIFTRSPLVSVEPYPLLSIRILWDQLRSIGIHQNHWDPSGCIRIQWDPTGHTDIH